MDHLGITFQPAEMNTPNDGARRNFEARGRLQVVGLQSSAGNTIGSTRWRSMGLLALRRSSARRHRLGCPDFRRNLSH